MTYHSKNISVTDALALLKARGISVPQDDLLRALRDGQLRASALVDGAWRELVPAWWRHVNSALDMDTVWFDRKITEPPTPRRAERIEVPRAVVESLWPEDPKGSTTANPTQQHTRPARRRGPKPKVLEQVIKSMRADIASGALTLEALGKMKEVALEESYKASRDTVRKARDKVLPEDAPPNSKPATNRDN